ncbi:MAG: radical SAM protein, partial [Candidatus Omnitrophota bacterium]
PEVLRRELSKEEVFSVIDQLARLGTINIAYTGGEIFTRPDLMDIVRYTRKKGLQTTLMTNGSLITGKIADELISLGIGKFEISFLGAAKETFDKMTQVKGSFEKVLSVTKMLRKKGVIPHIKTCVTNINLDEVDKIADLAKKLDVSFSYSPLVIPKLDLGQKPGSLRIRPDEFLDIKKRFLRFRENGRKPKKRKNPIKRKNPDEIPGFWEKECLFSCMAGHTGVFISPYGEMKACMTVPEPCWSVREYAVAECWERVKEFVDNLKAPEDWECFTCEYNAWCSWCPGRGYLNTGSIFGCPPYFKELAKARQARFEAKAKSAEAKRESNLAQADEKQKHDREKRIQGLVS